jgi:hypothetical protein
MIYSLLKARSQEHCKIIIFAVAVSVLLGLAAHAAGASNAPRNNQHMAQIEHSICRYSGL